MESFTHRLGTESSCTDLVLTERAEKFMTELQEMIDKVVPEKIIRVFIVGSDVVFKHEMKRYLARDPEKLGLADIDIAIATTTKITDAEKQMIHNLVSTYISKTTDVVLCTHFCTPNCIVDISDFENLAFNVLYHEELIESCLIGAILIEFKPELIENLFSIIRKFLDNPPSWFEQPDIVRFFQRGISRILTVSENYYHYLITISGEPFREEDRSKVDTIEEIKQQVDAFSSDRAKAIYNLFISFQKQK